MKISILTLFPGMFNGPFDYSIINRAKEKDLLEIEFIDIREFGIGKHKIVDDKPYGGGVGMVIRADVIKNALDSVIDKNLKREEYKIILTSAKGETYKQAKAREYSTLKHLILICGHYEGIDERVMKFVDDEISIGNFVLTGGEIPAMVITDSVARLIKGVLKDDATLLESFSEDLLEHPQYTRPEDFEGLKVPEVLLSGNHQEISRWKKEKSTENNSK
jgi:tRNA (guanine37-N1)-methyltransferase